ITIGLLVLVGAVGAQTYYTHELAKRVSGDDTGNVPEQSQVTPHNGNSDPWTVMQQEMLRMRTEMNKMFDHSFQDFHDLSPQGIMPGNANVSLEDQGNNYVVKADIPGAKENDIQVNLDGRLLSISAQTQGSQEQKTDNGKVIREENYASSFQRAFTLPTAVNAAGMHSQFHDGVLTVTIPKATS
ncbi:MAG: Hsp20/alpha crystallin family protein, partial [Chromatiales bacterium]